MYQAKFKTFQKKLTKFNFDGYDKILIGPALWTGPNEGMDTTHDAAPPMYFTN